MALQLTNQVFIDRALLVLPYHKSKIPDETEAINMLMNSSGIPGLDEGPAWPEHVKNEVCLYDFKEIMSTYTVLIC